MNIWTITAMAGAMQVPYHAVAYALQRCEGCEPIAKIGNVKVFSQETFDAVRGFVDRLRRKRGQANGPIHLQAAPAPAEAAAA